MAFTLPTYSRLIDNAMVETWYEIRQAAADQILESTVATLLLRQKGAFVGQTGGDFINRTIRYALPSVERIKGKGHVFSTGETESHSMASWTWRIMGANIQASMIQDVQNAGVYKIADYLARRTNDVNDSLQQQVEKDFFQTHVTDETGEILQGFNDLIPPVATRNTGTYGKINRPTTYVSDAPTVGNTFWSPRYAVGSGAKQVTLERDLDEFYDTVENQQVAPDMILFHKTDYSLLKEFIGEKVQLMYNGELQRFGFNNYMFRNATCFWSPNATLNEIRVMTSRYIQVVYNTLMYFDWASDEFKKIPNQLERVNQIVLMHNMITEEPRRHGMLYYT